MFGLKLHWWVFLGIALGFLGGLVLHALQYERINITSTIEMLAPDSLPPESKSGDRPARKEAIDAVAAEYDRQRAAGVNRDEALLRSTNVELGTSLDTKQLEALDRKELQDLEAKRFGQTFFGGALGLLADGFLKLLMFIVVPLVFLSLASGVINLGDPAKLGRLGLRTIGWYLMTSFVAILTGLLLVNVIRPGEWTTLALGGKAPLANLPDSVWAVLLSMIPSNPFGAMANGDLFGVIVAAILFGLATLYVRPLDRDRVAGGIKSLFEVIMKLTEGVLWLAPIGVAALIARLVAVSGIEPFRALLPYVLTLILTLGLHAFVTLPLLFWLFTRRNPFKLMGAMTPALLTGFSTASSSGTLPVTMERLEERVGVNNKVGSFVLPLGATMNMDGTALYEIVATLFIAQMYAAVTPDFDLTFLQQITIVFLALMVSIGAAGIPSAGLVMMVIIFQAVGLPIELTALLWTVDRVLDMCRTSVNIWSDVVGATTIAHFEGEIDESKLFRQAPAPAGNMI